MNTTEIKVTQTHTTESMVKIEIPSYRQDGKWHFYKIFSELHCLKVFDGEIIDMGGIEIQYINTAFSESSEEITEAIFTEAYEKVIDKLNSL